MGEIQHLVGFPQESLLYESLLIEKHATSHYSPLQYVYYELTPFIISRTFSHIRRLHRKICVDSTLTQHHASAKKKDNKGQSKSATCCKMQNNCCIKYKYQGAVVVDPQYEIGLTGMLMTNTTPFLCPTQSRSPHTHMHMTYSFSLKVASFTHFQKTVII